MGSKSTSFSLSDCWAKHEVDLVVSIGDGDAADDVDLGGPGPAKNTATPTGFQCGTSFSRWSSAESREKPLK